MRPSLIRLSKVSRTRGPRLLSRWSLSRRSWVTTCDRQEQGTSLPESGCPGGTSSRRKPAPLQRGQLFSSSGVSLPLEEVGVFPLEVL